MNIEIILINIVQYFIEIYTYITIYINFFIKKYNIKKVNLIQPFRILDVITYNDDDSTSIKSKYFTDSNWNENNFEKCEIKWSIDKNEYVSYLLPSTITNFPHYFLEEMRTCKKENKIIAALLEDKNYNSVEYVSDIIKQAAGPKANFYKDTDFKVQSRLIFGIRPNCFLTIINSKGTTLKYDLNTDNIIHF